MQSHHSGTGAHIKLARYSQVSIINRIPQFLTAGVLTNTIWCGGQELRITEASYLVEDVQVSRPGRVTGIGFAGSTIVRDDVQPGRHGGE
jgi:hypothetical protein